MSEKIPEILTKEELYKVIKSTNSCDSLSSPIEVHIDHEAFLWVTVCEPQFDYDGDLADSIIIANWLE